MRELVEGRRWEGASAAWGKVKVEGGEQVQQGSRWEGAGRVGGRE